MVPRPTGFPQLPHFRLFPAESGQPSQGLTSVPPGAPWSLRRKTSNAAGTSMTCVSFQSTPCWRSVGAELLWAHHGAPPSMCGLSLLDPTPGDRKTPPLSSFLPVFFSPLLSRHVGSLSRAEGRRPSPGFLQPRVSPGCCSFGPWGALQLGTEDGWHMGSPERWRGPAFLAFRCARPPLSPPSSVPR